MILTDKGMGRPEAAAVSVAIVEDHPEFREALSAAVRNCPGMDLLPVSKDLPAAVSLLEQVCPDVLLVDLGLPSGSGLQLFHMVQARAGVRCASAVLTVTGNEEHLLTAIGAGAKGYLFKSDREADWCHTIRLLAAGQSPLHATLAQTLLDRAVEFREGMKDEATRILLRHIAAGYTREETADRLKVSPDTVGQRIRALYDSMLQPRPNLSPREIQLLQLLNRGYPFKKCAELMGVSESTTKTQAARAYEKLGASNLQSALYEARQAGFLH